MPTEATFRIAVCDDMESDRRQVTDMAEQILQEAGIFHSISKYESAKALLADIEGGAQFQVLLLDVMMDEMDGMELAAALRKQKNKTTIMFISSNREMALRGYEVSAVRFLAKPVEMDKLKEALLYCCSVWQEKKEILLPTDQGKRRTSFADIQYVEAFDRGTRFVLAGETLESRLKFSEVEAMLPKPAFLMCHRAFVVNLACVKYIRNYEFVLKNGMIVPIGKARYAEINRKFLDYLAD